MNCPGDISLAELLDGDANSEQIAALKQHISNCTHCAAEFRRLGENSRQAGAVANALGNTAVAASEHVPLGQRTVSATGSQGDPPGGPMSAPHAGQIIGGRYRLVRLLGEGGMGVVWEAEHMVTRQRCALKLLRPDRARRAGLRRRALREARAASAVRHPNVVRVFDVFEAEDGAPVLVMDLLVGETLGQRLRRLGPIALGELAQLLVPALAAVKSAHLAGVIHRDLKPDNLFLVALPEGGADVRVVDFGLARLAAVDAGNSVLTMSGEMLGTPIYMSPEQAFGETAIDERTDAWALGVILYECLSGRRPFEGDNFGQLLKNITTGRRAPLAEVMPELPSDVVALVEGMLTVEREQRPGDLANAIDVLSRYAGVPPLPALLTPAPRLRARLAVGAALALVAALGWVVFRPVPRLSPSLSEASAIGPALAPSPIARDLSALPISVDMKPPASLATPAIPLPAPAESAARARSSAHANAAPPAIATPALPPPEPAKAAPELPGGVQGNVPF